MTASLADITNLGASSIPGDNPAGESARYDPEFEAISAEIGKLEAAQAEEPDWGKVVQLSQQILQNRSKDFLVAAYLTQGLLVMNGYPGLAAGLQSILGMVNAHWEGAFPAATRVRARNNALQWLGERASSRMESTNPRLADLEAVVEANTTVKAITEAWLQKSEERPTFAELTRYLENFQRTLEAEKKKQEDQAAARAVGGASAAAASGEPEAIASADDALKVVDQANQAMAKAVSYLTENELKLPASYLLNRYLAWTLITQEPPNDNGATMIPGVSPEIPPLIENALAEGRFQEILVQSETRLSEHPFWLDIQRHVADCLAGLGDEYVAARTAVIGATAGFVRRLPGVPNLAFATGVPFASDATRQWLQTEVLPKGGGGGGEEAQADPREEAYKDARKLVAKGKWPEAMALFRDGLGRTGSSRERFLWRLSQAKLCMEAGQIDVALPQFEALDKEVQRLGLEEWEPEMALGVIKSHLQCRNMLGSSGMADPETLRRLEDLRYRLARLDVASVIELNGNP